MKRLLFDGTATQGYGNTNYHGGGEYAKYYLRNALYEGFDFDIVFQNKSFTDPQILELLQQYPNIKIFWVNNLDEIYSLIMEKGYSRFYSALPYKYVDYKCDAKFIGVIHGLRGVELPWDSYRYLYEKKYLKKITSYIINYLPPIKNIFKERNFDRFKKILSIPNALFITVSNHSQSSLINYFPFLNKNIVRVFYSPFELPPKDDNVIIRDGNGYYLMVSANRYEKNIFRAIEVLDDLIEKKLINRKVVVLGCDIANKFFSRIKNAQYFDFRGYVSEEDLIKIYRGAFCFIYPSLNEGFGYPPILAQSIGIPVIASSATSIPEATGNIPLFFNPISKDDLACRIIEIENRKDIREQQANKGKQWANRLYARQKDETHELLNIIFNE